MNFRLSSAIIATIISTTTFGDFSVDDLLENYAQFPALDKEWRDLVEEQSRFEAKLKKTRSYNPERLDGILKTAKQKLPEGCQFSYEAQDEKVVFTLKDSRGKRTTTVAVEDMYLQKSFKGKMYLDHANAKIGVLTDGTITGIALRENSGSDFDCGFFSSYY